MPSQGSDYNSIQLIGNLGADPDVRYFESGSVKAKCRIAVFDGKNSDGTEKPSIWMEIQCWNDTAEYLANNFSKGDRLQIVEGRLSQDTWQDKTTRESRSKIFVKATKLAKIERGAAQKQAAPIDEYDVF